MCRGASAKEECCVRSTQLAMQTEHGAVGLGWGCQGGAGFSGLSLCVWVCRHVFGAQVQG